MVCYPPQQPRHSLGFIDGVLVFCLFFVFGIQQRIQARTAVTINSSTDAKSSKKNAFEYPQKVFPFIVISLNTNLFDYHLRALKSFMPNAYSYALEGNNSIRNKTSINNFYSFLNFFGENAVPQWILPFEVFLGLSRKSLRNYNYFYPLTQKTNF